MPLLNHPAPAKSVEEGPIELVLVDRNSSNKVLRNDGPTRSNAQLSSTRVVREPQSLLTGQLVSSRFRLGRCLPPGRAPSCWPSSRCWR